VLGRQTASCASFTGAGQVGWVKLARDPLLVDGGMLAELRAAPYQPIFNGQSPDEAPLRHMGRSPAWAARFEAHFASALREEGLLACSDGSEKSVCDCYALRSLGLGADAAGGDPALAGRQPPHSDAPEPPGEGAALPSSRTF